MKNIIKTVGFILLTVIILATIMGCGSDNSQYDKYINSSLSDEMINLVKNGWFANYSQKTIGAAFESFFDKLVWEYNTEENIVLSGGKALFNNEDAFFFTKFRIFGKNDFSLMSVEIVDTKGNITTLTSDKDLNALLDSIYGSSQNNINNTQSPSDNTSSPSDVTQPSNDQSSPSDNLCPYCDGIGFCSHCVFGECENCFGDREIDCSSCVFGDCINCSGDGGYYQYVYDDVKWVSCSSCRGSGFCRSCDGLGSKLCSYCSGTGNCNYCNGSGNCQYCYGSGKK